MSAEIKSALVDAVHSGPFDMGEMQRRIDVLFASGGLTESERSAAVTEMLSVARDSKVSTGNTDVTLADLTNRIVAAETAIAELQTRRENIENRLAAFERKADVTPVHDSDAAVDAAKEGWPQFIQPTAIVYYAKGDRVTFNGERFTSLIDANVWSPTEYPAGWKKEPQETAPETPSTDGEDDGNPSDGSDTGSETSTTPSEPAADEWPEFVQPTGAHDAYAEGAKVTFESKHYTSLIDANVYSPTAYPAGWRVES